MDDGMLDGQRVSPPPSCSGRTELLAGRPTRFATFEREGWGLGWDIGTYQGDRMVNRFGSYASYRSHVWFLPSRRVGVVAQVNGAPAGPLTDVIAAYVYDLAAGRPDADQRVAQALEGAGPGAERMKNAVREDRARRAARSQVLPRALSDYTGTLESPAIGRIEWRADGNGLHLRWGVLEPGTEVFDAAAARLRVQLPGSGEVATFIFERTGPATAVRCRDYTLARTDRQTP